MEIRFTDHAQQQIQERHLSKLDIIETIRTPDTVIKQSTHRSRAIRKIQKQSKTYLLVVIYDTQTAHKNIITAFLTSKIKKYL
jgi:hypothetical protein